ncbi:MAG: cell division protein FtsW [Kiritimatiellae bacterium]|nr:cell division protein FtsW [Kiritimatiellia bacterium]
MRKSALYALGLVVATLVALGLVVLSSASEANGIRLHNDAYFFMKRQAAYLVAGILVAVAMALFDYRKWREHVSLTILFYVLVVALLGAVFLFPAINGSQRWLSCGPLRLQPSELAKLAVVIAVAVWMDKAGWRVELFRRGALCPALIIVLLAALVLKEPDFGSTMVVGAAGFLVMFVAGTRLLHLLPFIGAGAIGFIVMLSLNANRMRRLAPYLNKLLALFNGGGGEAAAAATTGAPSLATMDPAEYQAYMARVAIQNGGIWGLGLGESMQKHAYLPEAHTDFIFAVGAEELGLFFSIAVIALFAAFFALSIYIARHAADRFGRFLVLGMSFIIFFQAMFNLGVVCEAMPTKGMALPFFSYGGTNLLSAFFAVGTIFSVGLHSVQDRKRQVLAKVVMRRRSDG